MKKQKIKFENNILPKSLIRLLPVFYRNLKRIPNDSKKDIINFNKLSESSAHRSKGMHLECNYKPNSKYIFTEHYL